MTKRTTVPEIGADLRHLHEIRQRLDREHTLFVLFIVGADAEVIPASSRAKACRDKLWPEISVFEPDSRLKELVLDCVNS